MRLLICTQAVDKQDPILGFFHRWIEEFAKHCEAVTVICLREGEHALPANVRVHSLGKEHGEKSKLAYALRFWRLLWKVRHEYDDVFVHMNPEYVILGSRVWRRRGAAVGLWYMHKSVDRKLKMAVKRVKAVFTASPESFRLPTGKLRIMGHGIDVERFRCPAVPAHDAAELRLVTVGRVSASKHLEVLFEALKAFSVREVPWTFDIIGSAVTTEDQAYEKRLYEMAEHTLLKSRVRFLGAKPQEEVAQLLCNYHAFLHASTGTGSLDKAALEAMSCGIPVISTSEAFRDFLAPHGLYAETPEAMASMLTMLAGVAGRADMGRLSLQLRREVAEKHSLQSLIPRILDTLLRT
jgi:glycosyltransferase involved in cell wall biosynthesis